MKNMKKSELLDKIRKLLFSYNNASMYEHYYTDKLMSLKNCSNEDLELLLRRINYYHNNLSQTKKIASFWKKNFDKMKNKLKKLESKIINQSYY